MGATKRTLKPGNRTIRFALGMSCMGDASEEGKIGSLHGGTGKEEDGPKSSDLSPHWHLVCLKDRTARRLRTVPELPAFAHADLQPGTSFSVPLLINSFSFSKKQFSHPSSRRPPRTTQEAKLLVGPPRTSFVLNLSFDKITRSAAHHPASRRAD